MAPRRPAATPTESALSDDMDLRPKIRAISNRLKKDLTAQRSRILAKYRNGMDDVQKRTQEKIAALGKKNQDAGRGQREQLSKITQLIKKRDAKMIIISQKLGSLKDDLEAFARILNAESKRIQNELKEPWLAVGSATAGHRPGKDHVEKTNKGP